MSNIVIFLKKYKIELMVILVLMSIPILEPILEVLINCIFTVGQAVGTWIRSIAINGFCK